MKTKTTQQKRHIKNLHRVAVVKTRQPRQAVKALLESEEIFRNLFENAKDMIVLADTETGIILNINMAGCRLLGLPKEKIIGRHQSTLHPQELAGKYKQLFQEHVQKGVVITENIFVQNTDGVQIPMDLSASVVKLAGKTIIQGVFRDMTERIKMEDTLANEATQQRIFIEQSRDGIVIIGEDGRVCEVNQSFADMLGYTIEEVRQLHLYDWDLSVPREKVPEHLLGIDKNGQNIERQHRRKDGTFIDVDISINAAMINGQKYVYAVSRDITERKRIENALENEAARRRVFIEQSRDGIVILDMNGKVFEANLSFANMLGYTMEEARQLHIFDWDVTVPREQMLENLRNTDENGANVERQHRRKDGTSIDVDISINTAMFNGQKYVLTVSRNITERKRIEKAFRESEEKFSKAFQAIPEALSISRYSDGKFIAVNGSFCRANGRTVDEVIGHTAEELGLWAQTDEYDQMSHIYESQGHIDNKEFEFKIKSGEIHTVLVSADVIYINGDKCVLTIGTDITERKRMENALRESEEKFSKAFHTIPESLSISTMNGTFVAVNESFCRANGLTADNVIGRTAQDLGLWVMSEGHDQIKHLVDDQGHVDNQEFEFQVKSGEIHTVLVSADTFETGGEKFILTIGNDITERKHMENALKESEEKFNKAFHAIPEALSITKVADGKFLDVNEGFCRANGFSINEVIGHTAVELGLWATSGGHDQIIRMIKKQGHVENKELEFKTKSGEIRTVLVSADTFDISGEKCILTIGNDITERKRIENALKDSEEKFNKAFHAIPEALSISTLDDGIFLDVNESFCRANGHTIDEVIGHTAEEIGLWVKSEGHDQMTRIIDKQGHLENKEFEFQIKSGEKRTVLVSADTFDIGGEKCVLTIGTDITERKRMENALKESEEKFSKAFHAIPESISISRLKDGKFVDVNDSFIRGLGFTREEFIGRSSSELGLWDRAGRREEMIKMVKERGSVINQEVEYTSQSGEKRTLLFSADIIKIGDEPCMLSISNDISDRKQAERQLHEAMTQLEASSAQLHATNKELESFSYSVSHDLRSPLRSIDGFSQALLEDYTGKLDEKGQDYLNRLRNASQKMGDLIDGLLKLSRLTRSEMHQEKVDLSALASEIVDRLKETQPKRRVNFTVDKDLTADGDPQMIRALLENLLGNAWKFTAKTKGAEIELGLANNGSKKTYFIRDNGAGFDMAFKDKLFGAFQRLHDVTEFPGTGIGLATVQRIVHRHGGTIWAESEVNKGATFYFSLSQGALK